MTAARALPRESRSARDSAGASAAGCGLLHVAASIRGSPSAFTPFFTYEDRHDIHEQFREIQQVIFA